jgi:hypothetical protein
MVIRCFPVVSNEDLSRERTYARIGAEILVSPFEETLGIRNPEGLLGVHEG